jgi:hypothetical protein
MSLQNIPRSGLEPSCRLRKAALCLLCLFIVEKASINAQNVGIGLTSPAIRLDLLSSAPHSARFSGPQGMYISFFEEGVYRGYLGSFSGAAEDVDFGTGGSNATGKLHLTTQASPRLTITPAGNVGIGTQTPSRKLDITGSLGFNGPLYVNGASGSSGQVLMSNGVSTPSWQDAALSNDTRFGIRMQKVGNISNTLDLHTTYYNLNPADVVLNPTSVVINKAGLYHFSGYMTGLVQGALSALPEMTCDLNIDGTVDYQYDLMQWKHMPLRTAVNNNYYVVEHYSFDLHITAPATLTFSMGFLTTPAATYWERNLRFFGYLVSE